MLSKKLKEDLKNPWLRVILGIIGITVSVNIIFITYAFVTPPNLVVNDYYERGKAYFHAENIRNKQTSHAWRLQLLLPKHPRIGEKQDYRLYVMDHAGKPVTSGEVTLFAYRPNDTSHDFKMTMSYADKGTFIQQVQFLLPGYWDLIAQIKLGDHDYDIAKRIYIEDK